MPRGRKTTLTVVERKERKKIYDREYIKNKYHTNPEWREQSLKKRMIYYYKSKEIIKDS